MSRWEEGWFDDYQLGADDDRPARRREVGFATSPFLYSLQTDEQAGWCIALTTGSPFLPEMSDEDWYWAVMEGN
jgi:hypothetical protein